MDFFLFKHEHSQNFQKDPSKTLTETTKINTFFLVCLLSFLFFFSVQRTLKQKAGTTFGLFGARVSEALVERLTLAALAAVHGHLLLH